MSELTPSPAPRPLFWPPLVEAIQAVLAQKVFKKAKS